MALAGKRILITGATGMLASDLRELLADKGVELLLTDVRKPDISAPAIEHLDITNQAEVKDALLEVCPDWVINCAAYTQVDSAEDNQGAAFAINADGPGNLARAVREYGGAMLHISTDYVFGGPGQEGRNRPYKEEDKPVPCGVYGHSKRHGDELVEQLLPDQHLIVRTSWLHGVHGPNFVQTMLKLGEENDELKVVNDQVGSPTWTKWLADMLARLIERDARGTFHATSRGGISWFDFANEIFSQAGLSVKIIPQTTEELARKAPRPAYSTLDVAKLEEFLDLECLSWKQAVKEHLSAIGRCS